MTRPLVVKTGDLVDLFDEGRLASGVVMGEEKGRYKVVTEGGKELRVAASRVVHRAGGAIVSDAAQGAAVAARHGRAAASRLAEIDLPSLWDVLAIEPRRQTLGELASLALGSDDSVARSAILRALHADRTYFERKGEDFEPRPRDQVEAALKREAAVRARLQRRAAFVHHARAALAAGATPEAMAPAADHREHVADLVELAIMGDEAGSRKEAVSLLDEAGVPDGPAAERAFRLLRALGVFKPDENLFIHRFGLRRAFPPLVLERASVSAARPDAGGVSDPPRRDLRHLEAFTVDDDLTTEMDDALSLETDGARLVIGVHIADPDCFVPAGDPVDLEAMARAATYYFPEVKLPMLPAVLAEQAASLVPDQDRPALSFLVILSPLGELLGSEIVPATIRSRARLTYEQADALMEDPASAAAPDDAGLRASIGRTLARLRPIVEALESERVAAGATVIRAAEVDIRVTPESEIRIRRIDDRGVSRRLVSEMMILANRVAAEFLAKRGIPAIYRKQGEPAATDAAAALPQAAPREAADAGTYDPVAVRALRRRMRRGETSLAPAPHHGLGLAAYTQATSPIRRYQDLVVHRQIKAALAGSPPPYELEALARIAATTDEAERAAREAERGTDEYWILRWYEGRAGQTVDAVVVETDTRRTQVELTDTLYTTNLAPRPDHRPGQRLRLVVEAVRPRAGRLTLRPVAP